MHRETGSFCDFTAGAEIFPPLMNLSYSPFALLRRRPAPLQLFPFKGGGKEGDGVCSPGDFTPSPPRPPLGGGRGSLWRRTTAPEDLGFDGERVSAVPFSGDLLLQRLEAVIHQSSILDLRQVRQPQHRRGLPQFLQQQIDPRLPLHPQPRALRFEYAV